MADEFSVGDVVESIGAKAPSQKPDPWIFKPLSPEKRATLSPGSSGLIEVFGHKIPSSDQAPETTTPPETAPAPESAPAAKPGPAAKAGPTAPTFSVRDVGTPLPPAPPTKLLPRVEQNVRIQAQRLGIDPSWVLPLFEAEGGGLDKISRTGAYGSAQLMPATAAAEGVDRTIPEENIRGGVSYLKRQLEKSGGNYLAAAAAYNAGPNNPGVIEFTQTGNPAGLPAETKAYLNRILALRARELQAASQRGEISTLRNPFPENQQVSDQTLRGLTSRAIMPIKELTQNVGSAWDTPGQDMDIDYRSGAPFSVRMSLEIADNPKEARNELEKFFKREDVGQDWKGRWWVRMGGKRVAVLPTTNLWQRLENMGASLAAYTPQNTGMAGGAMVGAAWGAAGGPPGIAIGAAFGGIAGWMAGYEASEAGKLMRGTWDKTAGEVLSSQLGQLEAGAMTEMIPTAGRWFKDWVRTSYAGVTPYIAAMTNRALGWGGFPTFESAAPKAKITQYKQMVARKLFDDPSVDKNFRAVMEALKRPLRSLGFSEDQIMDVMLIWAKKQVPPARELGQKIAGAAQAWITDVRNDVQRYVQDASRSVQTDLGKIELWGRTATSRLGEDIAKSFIAARKRFAAKMDSAMDAINTLSGDFPIFPMGRVVQTARELTGLLGSGTPSRIKWLADQPENLVTTFKEAHELRKEVRTLLDLYRVNPGTPSHKASELLQGIDHAFEYMADGMYENQPELKAVAGALRDSLKMFNKAYREGIQPFNNAMVNRIVKDYEVDHAVPDAQIVADHIFSAGLTEQTRLMLRMLPPDVKEQVGKYHILNIFKSALDTTSTGRAVVSGKALNAVLDEPTMRQLEELYDPRAVAEMKRLAGELAVVQSFEKGVGGMTEGYLDNIQELSPGSVMAALAEARQRQIALLSYVRDNPIAALLSNREGNVFDTAAYHVTRPGAEEITRRAKDLLMQYDPAAWEDVQRFAMFRVMDGALTADQIGHIYVNAKTLMDNIGGFTPGQQEMLFPGNTVGYLNDLAEVSNFLYPPRIPGKDTLRFAGGLSAGSTLGNIGFPWLNPKKWAAIIKWAHKGFWSWALYNREYPIRWLASVYKTDPYKAWRLHNFMMDVIVDNAVSGPGDETEGHQRQRRKGIAGPSLEREPAPTELGAEQ